MKPELNKILFLFAAALFLRPCGLAANPELDRVTHGEASIQEQGAVYDIHQASDKLIARFKSFDIDAGEITNLYQPSSRASALFRILDENPSQILGSLNADGQLFLINPNGIVFGRDASVNVGGLVASTLDLSDADYLKGELNFARSPGSPAGLVENRGLLRAREGGALVLIGGAVKNTGTMEARGGSAVLAAGGAVQVALDPEGLVSVEVEELSDAAVFDAEGNKITGAVTNSGTIAADGGYALLTAKAAQDVFDQAINHEGLVRANAVEEREGAIYLVGGDEGIVSVTGTLDASGGESGQKGGTIRVLGEKVGVFGDALLDASGDAGGGEILVGGDYQGANETVPNAFRTFVGADAILKADAGSSGGGGKVIVWADDVTRFAGRVSARGGSLEGNGGFAEISGKESLVYRGSADLLAPAGEKGTLFLDPKNITINNAGGSALAANDAFAENAAADATLLNTDVAAALDGANLTLQANNDITVSNAIDASGNAGTGNLALQAGRSIAVNADITVRGSFTATANHAGAEAANRDAGDAAFTMGAAQTINTSGQNGGVSITYGNGPADNTVGGMTLGKINSGTGALTVNATDTNESENVDFDGAVNSGAISITGQVVRFDANITTTNGGGLTVTNGGVTDGTSGVVLNLDGAFTQNGSDNNNILYGITTTGDDINFLRPMNFFADVLMSTGSGGGDIVFQGAMNNAQNLSLNAGTGDITFSQAVGPAAALTSIAITAARNVNFTNTVQTTGAVTQTTGSGTTTFSNTVTAGGGVDISNDGIAFSGGGNISAAGDPVRLNAETGAITGGTAVNDITASSVNLDAVTGIGTGANPLEVQAGTFNVDSSGTGNVVVDSNAAAGVTVNSLTSGTGDITFTQTGNQTLAVTNAAAGTGSVTLSNTAADLTVTAASAGGSGESVSLTTVTSGDINVGSVTASGGTVTVNAADNLFESGADAAADLTGATLDLTAGADIGTAGNPIELSGTSVTTTAGGTVYSSEVTSSLSGTFSSSIDSTLAGDLTVSGLTVTGSGNDIRVVSTSGDITAANVISEEGGVELQAAGNILGSGGGSPDISAEESIRLTAGGTVGTRTAPVSIQLETGGKLFLRVSGQTDGLSANLKGNVDRGSIVFLNTPPGLVIYNGVIIGGGLIRKAEASALELYLTPNSGGAFERAGAGAFESPLFHSDSSTVIVDEINPAPAAA